MIHVLDRRSSALLLIVGVMCGRATLAVSVEEIAEAMDALPLEGELGSPRYNLAPSQPMIIVRLRRGSHTREMALATWGLVPHWAKPDEAKSIAHRCVQARVETLAKAPAFRDAFKSRRCLVVVDGFYEWNEKRMPFHVRREDKKPFAIAGVWERWTSPASEASGREAAGVPERSEGGRRYGEIVESCAVVTTKAEGKIRELHDRMPLVVPPDDYDKWLGGGSETIMASTPELVTVPVSKYVNSPKNDDPRCIEPITAGEELGPLFSQRTRARTS